MALRLPVDPAITMYPPEQTVPWATGKKVTWLVPSHVPICLPSGEQTDWPGAVQLPLLVLTPAGGGASGVAGAAGAAGAVPTGGEGATAGADGATGAEGAGAGADGAGEAAGEGIGASPEPEPPEPEPPVLPVSVDAEVPVPQEPTGGFDGKVGSFCTD